MTFHDTKCHYPSDALSLAAAQLTEQLLRLSSGRGEAVAGPGHFSGGCRVITARTGKGGTDYTQLYKEHITLLTVSHHGIYTAFQICDLDPLTSRHMRKISPLTYFQFEVK